MEGEAFAGSGEVFGEVVFNTATLGYQEIITDPASRGQILTMTYPLIGNYGINKEDEQSTGPQISALLVREYSPFPSSWRQEGDLATYLNSQAVLAVEGIDTRALTRHLSEHGTQKGVLSTVDLNIESLLAKLQKAEIKLSPPKRAMETMGSGSHHVVVMDFGVTKKDLTSLTQLGCSLTIVPAETTASEILNLSPDGIFLSSGPGDPTSFPELVKEIKKLIGVKPIFGIGFGHLLLGLANGFSTFKLSRGHRGANQPVLDLALGNVLITTQNHGFCLNVPGMEGIRDPQAAKNLGGSFQVTHVNVNDLTVEGMAYDNAFSVQFIPSLAGPDSLFKKFIRMMEGEQDA